MAPPLQHCYLYWDQRRHRHLLQSHLSADHTSKTIAIIVLLKCVLSAIFSPQPSSTSASNSNHHSPPLLAGSNSLSFFVCKGPLLSSLRRALIRSATLNKEGRMERKRGRGGGEREREASGRRRSSGDIRVSINRVRAAAKGPWLGCVWSVSFKGGTAGRAITDDFPLAAGPGATLTESNHKQVNSTSTFLIFFPPVSSFGLVLST